MIYAPKFSVILPTYNRGYILWRAIQSVLGQTYPFFELVIIDDGSSDDTQKTVKVFRDPRIIYFKNRKRQGVSAARNKGLKKARGEYIAYLDSDNEWHKDFLESMLSAIAKYPKKVLFFCKKNYRLKLSEKDKIERMIRDEFYGHKKYFDLKRLWQRKIIIDTNTFVHKKSLLDKIGRWDEKIDFWEDYEFTLRVSRYFPQGIMYLNRALVDYEQTLDFKSFSDEVRRWEKAEEYIFKKHEDYPLIKEAKWYPPKAYKSTESVLKFLQAKKP
ncbi:MAG: glycosyltransferase family 2 protein [Patescibacteria group bacterium]